MVKQMVKDIAPSLQNVRRNICGYIEDTALVSCSGPLATIMHFGCTIADLQIPVHAIYQGVSALVSFDQ